VYVCQSLFFLPIYRIKWIHIKVIIDSIIILHHNIEFLSFFMSTNRYHFHENDRSNPTIFFILILTHLVMQYYFQEYTAVAKRSTSSIRYKHIIVVSVIINLTKNITEEKRIR
jgi:hypothetical protein